MTYREVIEYKLNLLACRTLTGRVFSNAFFKNYMVFEKEIEVFEKTKDKVKYDLYEKDEQGTPILKDGKEVFDEALYKAEIEKLLDMEVEVSLTMIGHNDLPDNVSGEQRYLLRFMIKD